MVERSNVKSVEHCLEAGRARRAVFVLNSLILARCSFAHHDGLSQTNATSLLHNIWMDYLSMPPPVHLYIPGTKKFDEAIESGALKLSLPTLDTSAQRSLPESVALRLRGDCDCSSSSETLLEFSCNEDFNKSLRISKNLFLDHPVAHERGKREWQDTPQQPGDFGDAESMQYLEQELVRDGPVSLGEVHLEEDDHEVRDSSVIPLEVTRSQCHYAGFKRTRSSECVPVEKTLFKDIIGHGAVKVRISEILLTMALPFSVSEAVFTGVRTLPASILLYGPPGTYDKISLWMPHPTLT